MSRQLARLLAPIRRQMRLLAGRAILTLIDDSTKLQRVQVQLLDGEICDKVDRLQHYGFSSVALPGAEGIYLAIGGSRDNGATIADDDRRYRPKNLQPGEVVLYTDEDAAAGDCRVHFKRGKELHLIAGATRIVLTPAGLTITTPALNIVKA